MAAASLKQFTRENVRRKLVRDGINDAEVYYRRALHGADGQSVPGGQ
jgi:hypothetical protein